MHKPSLFRHRAGASGPPKRQAHYFANQYGIRQESILAQLTYGLRQESILAQLATGKDEKAMLWVPRRGRDVPPVSQTEHVRVRIIVQPSVDMFFGLELVPLPTPLNVEFRRAGRGVLLETPFAMFDAAFKDHLSALREHHLRHTALAEVSICAIRRAKNHCVA
jgi:hypothetical protein